jgi:hypothetical protein
VSHYNFYFIAGSSDWRRVGGMAGRGALQALRKKTRALGIRF